MSVAPSRYRLSELTPSLPENGDCWIVTGALVTERPDGTLIVGATPKPRKSRTEAQTAGLARSAEKYRGNKDSNNAELAEWTPEKHEQNQGGRLHG